MSKNKSQKRLFKQAKRQNAITLITRTLFGRASEAEEFEVEKRLMKIPLYREAREGVVDFLVEEGKMAFDRRLSDADYQIDIIQYAELMTKKDQEVVEKINLVQQPRHMPYATKHPFPYIS